MQRHSPDFFPGKQYADLSHIDFRLGFGIVAPNRKVDAMTTDAAFQRLAKSKFRSRFRLSEADRKYIAVRYCAGAIASQHAGMREA